MVRKRRVRRRAIGTRAPIPVEAVAMNQADCDSAFFSTPGTIVCKDGATF
jgi:hypothetical protein